MKLSNASITHEEEEQTKKHHDSSLAIGTASDNELGFGMNTQHNQYIFDQIHLQTFLQNDRSSQHAFENEALRYSIRK